MVVRAVTSRADDFISSTPIPERKEEVTRTVRLSPPDTTKRARSATPFQKQTVVWKGPIQALFGYSFHDVEGTEDWWLDKLHPEDRDSVLESLTRHLLAAPERPFAADSRIWGPDYRFRHADGRYILVSDRTITTRDQYGNAMMFESVVFDKEARRNERENHARNLKSQDRLALVANNTPSGIFMMDPQGYCIFMNSAAEQITGFTFDEIHDYTFHASVHSCRPNGKPFPLHECPVYGHQQDGTAAKNESEIFVHKDGHHYDIEYSVSPIGDYASGGAVIEFRDVTEQKKIERERLNAVLMTEQQSIRIKADDVHKANMTSFVSFICHEIRNPLQGVTSSAEFLLETLQKMDTLASRLSVAEENSTTDRSPRAVTQMGESTPISKNMDTKINYRPSAGIATTTLDVHARREIDDLISYAKQLVGNIQTCAEHQALITNNVLDLSRLDAGKMELSSDMVNIHALGQQTVEMMLAKAQDKHINLAMAEGRSRTLYLKADATVLRQVLLNLISNAIKFTPEHGDILVDMFADPPCDDGRITLHGSVTDNGLGMSEIEQRRLFQRFSQANRRVAQLYGGSGLGLSISKELVRVMGGEMHVKSAKGMGSTFSFTSIHDPPTKEELSTFEPQHTQTETLPVVFPLGDSELAKSEVASESPSPKFRMIGVAEDNPINLQYLAKNLKKLGYQYTLCTNGKEILDKFCEPGSTIDCCILDISMPVMDGLESARLMREHEASLAVGGLPRQRTPIIAL
ncbi:hypothetical protein MMC18_003308 [Xylographa bjoerkii]|nr:hypothetical protein [Xylographa bjoerkii]